MSRPPTPVFLERRTYRRRRLMDAARLLPVVGGLLFLVPLLWTSGPDEGAATAPTMIYVFAVWAGLIVTAVLLARKLSGKATDDQLPEGRERAE
jgi:hypothetical protein